MAGEPILVVDDDPGLLTLMKARLEGARYGVSVASGGEEALACASEKIFRAAILDLKMEGMDGIELMERLLKIQPYLPVIILTAYGTIERAVEATKKGAYDFLTKPFEAKDLLYRIGKALELGRLKVEVDRLRHLVKERYKFDNIIASSEKMQRILNQVAQIASTDSTVCIYGESGTGKELMAKAIHLSSPRAEEQFVAINCGAIPEGLLENELFGHVKGAFTGADQPKKGLLQQADGGTLFMDEIAELSPQLQVKLLRVFQDREFYAVGGLQPIRVDIRLIAATNQDLWKAIREGKFREDLYYRIHVIPIVLPPLRERIEDVPLLANHFLQHFNSSMNKNVQGFSAEAMQRLMLHGWPGNVRELANAVERAVALSTQPVITPEGLFLHSESAPQQRKLMTLNAAREEHERAYLTQLLSETRGNVSRAAALAGRYRPEFYKLLHKYGLNPADYKTSSQLPQDSGR
ncbi:MAG: sigma-54 dependent transcriptional regulator [Desulfobacteraceae bacterium]|nr:sigma-54 dependent transcriptional regulator [Desulfobacteraceae bacterium]